jgi:hypothetical protein
MTARIDSHYGHRVTCCHMCSDITDVRCIHEDNSVVGWCKPLGKEVDAMSLDTNCELELVRVR